MNRFCNLNDFRIDLIRVNDHTLYFFICQLARYFNQKEATEHVRQSHFLDDTDHTLQNNQTQNASINPDNELDHFDIIN